MVHGSQMKWASSISHYTNVVRCVWSSNLSLPYSQLVWRRRPFCREERGLVALAQRVCANLPKNCSPIRFQYFITWSTRNAIIAIINKCVSRVLHFAIPHKHIHWRYFNFLNFFLTNALCYIVQPDPFPLCKRGGTARLIVSMPVFDIYTLSTRPHIKH